MPRPLSPQFRFLLRAVACFIALLPVWWFALLPPLLAWERISTDLLLSAVPRAPLATGVDITAAGVWVVQAPVPVAGTIRNVRVELERRLPVQLTVAMPLFWAVMLAAPRSPRVWKALTWGSAALLLLPPIGLIAYAAHVTQIYVHPDASPFAIGFFATADYVAGTVAPYACPVVLAVGLHPKLRQTILTGAGPTPSSLTALPGRGSPAGK